MKISKTQHAFYIGTAPYNTEIVIITDTGLYGCLKVLANNDKYFNGYYAQFQYFNGKNLKKITQTELKTMFKKAIETDPKRFSRSEWEKLGDYFKIKIEKYLGEQTSLKFPTPGRPKTNKRGTKKDYNSYNKNQKWEVPPSKRKRALKY